MLHFSPTTAQSRQVYQTKTAKIRKEKKIYEQLTLNGLEFLYFPAPFLAGGTF
jgi:hypothetical protein